MKKRILALFAVLTLLLGIVLSGCSTGYEWEKLPLSEESDPLYRDYYHVFVYSFADGDGDGVGDLKGIESKLDYIAELGFTGIFLSPVHPSNTYHKYDVKNYLDIDSAFGTLEDFDSLVESAHERGIAVMMDLVINHTSRYHPWFLQAQEAYRNNTDSKYRNYYTFNGSADNYATFGGYADMPKLNLSDSGVKQEIENICRFWLEEHDVDAFRLDAAYHFYGNSAKNIEFMKWLTATAQKYNPDVYMVGEVWQNSSEVYSHYAEDSVQSFFNFALSNASGYNSLFPLLGGLQDVKADTFKKLVSDKETGTAKGIDALFASNHDTSRISNQALSYFSNRDQVVRDDLLRQHKMGIAALYTMSGNVFSYYGNEIGMRNGQRTITGSDYIDQTYRIAMNWDSSDVQTHENGFAYSAYGEQTRFGKYDDLLGGVKQQQDDQNSLYNHYRRVMLLRRQNPEIARGTTRFADSGFGDVAIALRDYNGKTVMLVYNFSGEETRKIDVSATVSANGMEGNLVGFVSSDYSEKVKNGKQLEMPPFSIAVIR